MGLNDGQTRDQDKLDYHWKATLFNASLTAVNIAPKAIQQDEIYNQSMNNFIKCWYNQKFAETIYYKLSQNDAFDLMKSIWLQTPVWGNLVT